MLRNPFRRAAALLLALLLAGSAPRLAAAEETAPEEGAAGSLEIFAVDPTLCSCDFPDVAPGAWYYEYAAYAQTLGLIQGRTGGAFAPQAPMTVAETVVLAVRIYEQYYGIVPEEVSGETWYAPYVARAQAYGILPGGCDNYTDAVRREQAAAIFCRMLPAHELAQRSEVDWIPDVRSEDPYAEQILTLYRAGVLSGINEYGVFHPKQTATRAELVKLMCAVINPALRRDVALPTGSLDAFPAVSEDAACSFSDVAADAWYYDAVCCQEQLGIMNGVAAGRFAPDGTVTLAQALKVAVTVYETYHGLIAPAGDGRAWYSAAVEKALRYGILSAPLPDYERPATRGEIITFLTRCIHESDLAAQNEVAELPDVLPGCDERGAALLLYRAGVMRGSNACGVADLELYISRAELAALLSRLLLPEQRLRFTLEPADEITFHYGMSGSGKYPLTGYRLGHGENVLVLTFAIHGWEDNWARDGKELVGMADEVRAYLSEHMDLIEDGGWTVYILRCLNPDGLYLGTTNNGPGRCTTTRLDEAGRLLTDRGIDMNRCFPCRYVKDGTPRNFNGTAPLQCLEAQKLAKFLLLLPQTGKRVSIDVHGWLTKVIACVPDGTLSKTLLAHFPDLAGRGLYGSGYLSSWLGYDLGFDSALLELPGSITSHQAFVNAGCTARLCSAVADLLQHYEDRGAPRRPETELPEEFDS